MVGTVNNKLNYILLSFTPVLVFITLFSQANSTTAYAEDGMQTIGTGSTETLIYLPIVSDRQFALPPGEHALDGSWKGDAITDDYPAEIQPVSFIVEAGGKRIASGARIDTYYEEKSGYWTCYGTVEWTINQTIPIAADGTFSISGGMLNKLTWRGRFIAPDQVEGTFQTEVFASLCGTIINEGAWSATWQGP
ncbi:MAG: hypothetical protein JSV42_10020 [Chloroflexota bacterium]|nr:MAG: hypothetical protein JSV42_10020 [Chloroflexota bacterium]